MCVFALQLILRLCKTLKLSLIKAEERAIQCMLIAALLLGSLSIISGVEIGGGGVYVVEVYFQQIH